ncbi:MAG: hypothetical protein V4725_15190 [Bacteroidota bacterium]
MDNGRPQPIPAEKESALSPFVDGDKTAIANLDLEKSAIDTDEIRLEDTVVELSNSSVGYHLWHFRLNRMTREYVIDGLFWLAVRKLLHKKGYAKRAIGKDFLFIKKTGNVIKEVSAQIMRDDIIRYVEAFSEGIRFMHKNFTHQFPPEALLETFLNNSNNLFNNFWLQHLNVHSEPLLKDIRDEMFFVFQNGVVTVSREGVILGKLEAMKGICIWEDQIIPHRFVPESVGEKTHFEAFLSNISYGNEQRLITMYSGIGYLLHHYSSPSEGQAVILYDESMGDGNVPMGGSGKGILVNAIKQVRRVSKVDGKLLEFKNKFKWEMITPSTQVAWLDDVKPDFDFSMLHSNLAEGWTIERKFLPQYLIAPEDSPKTVISSNSIIKGSGPTNKRRQFIIEVGDFYSKQIIHGHEKPIQDTHGCMFFDKIDWQNEDWNGFFMIMLSCAQLYLTNGLVPFEGSNVEYKKLIESTNKIFVGWVQIQNFQPQVDYDTTTYWQIYLLFLPFRWTNLSQRQFSEYLKDYATYKGWKYVNCPRGGTAYFRFE